MPLPSEAALGAVMLGGTSAPIAVAVATVGNVLGAATLFLVGRALTRSGGGRFAKWIEKKSKPEAAERARARLKKWGAPLLLFSFLPVVGDVFVVAAGALELSFVRCFAFVTAGKAARYAVAAWLIVYGVSR